MHQLGPKWGGFTMLLDMIKAVIPSLIFRLLFPDNYYYMINALFVMIGHNYPVYYGFRGGRGLSAMMGGFFVFDIIGTISTAILGVLIGVLSGQVVLIRWAGMILMIFWALIFHKGWQPPMYVLCANMIFWFAMRSELARFLELRKENMITDQKIVAEFMGMGSMYGLVERFGIPNILKRIKKKK
jgi:glycerol-3-phosphate acyltransferase PlsY